MLHPFLLCLRYKRKGGNAFDNYNDRKGAGDGHGERDTD